ncbi:hypothetical protein Q3G72_002812 [Acer saccharum]|nr:hypothetical protein Q3G72_002812 [Acer saccharum]
MLIATTNVAPPPRDVTETMRSTHELSTMTRLATRRTNCEQQLTPLRSHNTAKALIEPPMATPTTSCHQVRLATVKRVSITSSAVKEASKMIMKPFQKLP